MPEQTTALTTRFKAILLTIVAVAAITAVTVIVLAVTGSDGEPTPATAASPRQTAQQQYMAIVQNQGALIADQVTMLQFGDAACYYLANSSAVNGPEGQRRWAVASFVLQTNLSQRYASAIVGAAQNSGLCSTPR